MSIIEPYDTEGDFMIGLKRKLVEMVAFDLEPLCITDIIVMIYLCYYRIQESNIV